MPLRGSRLTGVLIGVLVLVVVLCAGAAVAISALQRRPASSAGPGPTGAAAARGAPAPAVGPTRYGAASRTSPATSLAQQVPASSAPLAAPSGPSGNLTVSLSPGLRSSAQAQGVRELLQSYFDAINQHDFSAWSEVVSTSLAARQDPARWRSAYASTVDSSIWVLSAAGDPPRVRLRFTSQQDPDLAPQGLQVDCIDWTLTYQLARKQGRLVVDSTVADSATMTQCRS